ncbi:hypothetical protein N9Y92_00430 [Chlamydiales bacterium]|nr:hypothetical protein [Chlamydiales bacterium]
MDEELSEKDFISNDVRKNPTPFWFWLFFVAIIIISVSTVQSWYLDRMQTFREDSPFFRVSNRQFSLFLWENPQFMRVNVSSKNAYLPGFEYLEKVGPKPEIADQFVEAPPMLLFHYHTWKRLIGDEISERQIPVDEFMAFLEHDQEWLPKWWPDAPPGYPDLIDKVYSGDFEKDLSTLPYSIFPLDLRLSFIGWKNFFKEGSEINAMNPTYEELDAFLDKNRYFARNFWRNLTLDSDPTYLWTYSYNQPNPETLVEKNQISPFLRVALFNFLKSLSESGTRGTNGESS